MKIGSSPEMASFCRLLIDEPIQQHKIFLLEVLLVQLPDGEAVMAWGENSSFENLSSQRVRVKVKVKR